jgi:hypothetical protein
LSDEVSYSLELSNCDGSQQTIVDNSECIIPISVLRDAPFFLEWGTHVYAKIVATNAVDDSDISPEGNGAMIVTVPLPPINLENVDSITNGNQIGLQWVAGLANGGSPVIDYRISYDQAAGDDVYVELISGLTTESYTAQGLTRGSTYKFKVQARNEYGYSDYSEMATILAAQRPDQVIDVTTTVTLSTVTFDWVLPSSGGSPIIGFRVFIGHSDLVTYTQDLVNCNGVQADIIASVSCEVPITALRQNPFNLPWGSSVYAYV